MFEPSFRLTVFTVLATALKRTVVFLVLLHVCSGYNCLGNRTFTIEEGSSLSLTCEVPYANATVDWYLIPDDKSDVFLGYCSFMTDGCSSKHDGYELGLLGQVKSKLTIGGNLSFEFPASVNCVVATWNEFMKPEVTSTETCRLAVEYPADRLRNCTIQQNSTDGSVFGSCDVDRIDHNGQLYRCRWTHRWKKQTVWSSTSNVVSVEGSMGQCRFHGYRMQSSLNSSVFFLRIGRGESWYEPMRIPVASSSTPTVSDDSRNENDDSTLMTFILCTTLPVTIIIITSVIVVVVKRRKDSVRHASDLYDNPTNPVTSPVYLQMQPPNSSEPTINQNIDGNLYSTVD